MFTKCNHQNGPVSAGTPVSPYAVYANPIMI